MSGITQTFRRLARGLPARPLHDLRTAVAGAVLRRVAGPDPTTARNKIHATPGPRWFDPSSPIGRVHGDASMFPGGVRALLLQSLHPRAMAAVAAHSGYRGDPWGRLQRTATFIATTTFGPADDAARMVGVVRAVHSRISGTTSLGEYYEASDPHLLRWVHMAEIDSFLMAHQRFGRLPLTPAECDEYVAQTAVIGRALGATDVPVTLAELHRELAAYRPELMGTEEARAAARFLLLTPPLPLPVRPLYWLVVSAGVTLMPGWSRRPLGLPRLPRLEPTLGHGVGRVMTAAIRWALDSTPPARVEQGPGFGTAGPAEPVAAGSGAPGSARFEDDTVGAARAPG